MEFKEILLALKEIKKICNNCEGCEVCPMTEICDIIATQMPGYWDFKSEKPFYSPYTRID